MKYYTILFILFVWFPIYGISQTMEVYQEEINLPDEFSSVYFSNGYQDSRGFVWLSSSKGELYRYDGQHFKKYGSEYGLPTGGDCQIYEDSEKMILLNYYWSDLLETKILLFDPVYEKATPLAQYSNQTLPFKEDSIKYVLQNTDETIWFSLFNGDIFELNAKKIKPWENLAETDLFNSGYRASKTTIYTIESSGDSTWITCSQIGPLKQKKFKLRTGLTVLNMQPPGGGRHLSQYGMLLRLEEAASKKRILAYCTSEHLVYLGEGLEKLFGYHLIGGKLIFQHKGQGIVFDNYLKVVARYDCPENESFLFVDREQGWWTTNGRGNLKRNYFKSSKFHTFDQSELNLEWYTAARGIAVTNVGETFISKGGSLSKIDRNGDANFYKTPIPYSSAGDFFGLLLEEDKKVLWVTIGGIITKFNIETNKFEETYDIFDEISTARQPYRDKNGEMWLGGTVGLCLYNEQNNKFERFEGYPTYKLPQKFNVSGFYENKRGLWLATGQGIFLIDPKNEEIHQFHAEGEGVKYLPHNVIANMQEDEDGTFWLASKGGGLIHWDSENGNYEQYTTDNGLKDDVIYACYQDDFNQVWLPSNNGLMRFDKTTKAVIHYTESDGILDREFNTLSHYADSLGRLYFGGLKGVIRFHPKDFAPVENPYNLVITSFNKTDFNDSIYVNDPRAVLDKNQITILPEDKEIQIDFALLNFENSEQWTYEYQIEGFHKDWKSLEAPSVFMRGLPYGTYKLLFRCQVSGYNWKVYDNPIIVLVLAPYYTTWWFIVLVVLLFIFIIWGLIRWRLAAALKKQHELEAIVVSRTREISEQAEELKSLDKMKTQFFANISHELRTPLTLILGPVQGMKKNKEINPFQIQTNLDVINRNAEKLLGLVDEVLNLSKLDAGKLTVNEEATSLIDFTRYIKSNFESNAQLNTIGYHLNFELSAKSSFYIDQSKVGTILTNFLSNAFKFCGENGIITLRVEERESTLFFNVSDKGIGIKTEEIPFVFDRFYQIRSKGNIAHGGTGIGLSLSRELVRLMDGEIGVESEYGKGSSFYFEIPKKVAELKGENGGIPKTEIENPVKESNVQFDSEKTCLLLVEDNPDMSNYIQTILKKEYEVIAAKNGAEGLRVLEEHKKDIDLVISDVMMPIMDGFTMLQKLKENEHWFNLPIIMLTARASEADKLHALTVGADDYLTKPFSSEELIVRIQNLLVNYESRKLWKNDLTRAVKSISDKNSTSSTSVEKEINEEQAIISKKDLVWLKDVENKIKKELKNEAFNVQTLAEEMFLSKRQFERKIKLLTGLTAGKLVLEIRLTSARKHLEDGHFSSVAEVSYAVGMQTPNYFSKVYAKRFGRKPSNYFK